jgi:hypothetical protein
MTVAATEQHGPTPLFASEKPANLKIAQPEHGHEGVGAGSADEKNDQ